ncbi:MAG: hypothetical protein HY762_06615 [Planctomycetes bacterium]|nr:hypothetical protein [Planctomycetota bacterium]
MPNFIRIKNNPYHWLVNDAYRRAMESNLVGKEQLLYERAASGALKDNNARTIFTFTLPDGPQGHPAGGQELFVKRYKFKRGLFNIIKSIFASSSALTELRISNYLIGKGKNTVYPVAALEKRKLGITVDSFLLLKKLDGMTTLNEAGIKSLPRDQKNILLQTLGKLIRDIHNINFLHRDLHTGNILLKQSGDLAESPDLFLIDLHRSYVLPEGLSRARKMTNLAEVSFSLWKILAFSDVVRFLKAYRYLDFRPARLKEFYREVAERMIKIRHRLYHRRAKRCLRSGSRYLSSRRNTPENIYQTFTRRMEPRIDFSLLIEAHNEIVRQASFPLKHPLIKHTANRSITVYGDKTAGGKIYIKEYRYLALASRLKSLFGYHPAKMAWVNGNNFQIRGIPTAPPLALVVEKDPFWLWAKRAYLITQEVKATTSNQYVMDTFISASSASPPASRWTSGRAGLRCKFIREFAFAVRRLHNNGIFHCDLKANNILVEDQPQITQINPFNQFTQRWSFHFIDLDRVRFSPRISMRRRIKNLTQLNAAMPAVMTRADRLRFWRIYANGLVSPGREKSVIRQIMQITIKRRHIWPG